MVSPQELWAAHAADVWLKRGRAEATDVANAVLDGVDGILLGAETLRGLYPRATVETTLHICKQAELIFDHREHFYRLQVLATSALARRAAVGHEAGCAGGCSLRRAGPG